MRKISRNPWAVGSGVVAILLFCLTTYYGATRLYLIGHDGAAMLRLVGLILVTGLFAFSYRVFKN